MSIPNKPKIYHIVHVDRLPSVIADGYLWCDRKIMERKPPGTTIGINKIKQRRLNLPLSSHQDLRVGDCVPFYFCTRSVMLYLIHQANHPELTYRDGQEPIVHLEADLYTSVAWAKQQQRRWAFTLSNAGSFYFEDRCNLSQLNQINWSAIKATQWQSCREEKQAEFLMDYSFPWQLVNRIGVLTHRTYQQVTQALRGAEHRPRTELKQKWYY